MATNAQVMQAFIYGEDKPNHTKSESIWFRGNTIYSYTVLSPIAVCVPEEFIYFVNLDTSSMTTTTHRNLFKKLLLKAGRKFKEIDGKTLKQYIKW